MEVVEGCGGDITSFLKTQQGDIDSHLLDAGIRAVFLLRGFHVPDAVELDQIARSLNLHARDCSSQGAQGRQQMRLHLNRGASPSPNLAPHGDDLLAELPGRPPLPVQTP